MWLMHWCDEADVFLVTEVIKKDVEVLSLLSLLIEQQSTVINTFITYVEHVVSNAFFLYLREI